MREKILQAIRKFQIETYLVTEKTVEGAELYFIKKEVFFLLTFGFCPLHFAGFSLSSYQKTIILVYSKLKRNFSCKIR